MNWLFELHEKHTVAHAIGVLSFVCVLGMALGSVRFRGIGLGTSGVLFAGIIVGHFGEAVDHATLDFVKEFGLILFVFSIGLQLGPGFFAALRQQGVKLNLLAATVVILGAVCAAVAGWIAGFDPAAVLGIFSGASTNTPSLGAGSQTLSALPGIAADRLTLPALAYAVTYPAAIIGIIVTLLLLKLILRIDPVAEAAAFVAKQHRHAEPLERRTLVVTNPNLEGVLLGDIPGSVESGVTFSRIRQQGEIRVAGDSTLVHLGDLLSVVGTRDALDRFSHVIGRTTDEDLDRAAKVLGNSLKELNETHFIPLFIGLVLGIALGTMPIPVPGIPQPVQLGLAGGPLVVALILGRIGRIGRQVWHMPVNTNLAFREFGIALFFAAVGLGAGAKFFDTVFSPIGLQWLAAGVVVTILPLLLVGIFARLVLKMNFMDLSGMLAGSMTDPPALAFASNIAGSDAPAVAYATVYPLTTLLRILAAQILAIILFQ